MQNDFGFNFDNSYARLPESFFSIVDPSSAPCPQEVIVNDMLAELLGLEPEALKSDTGLAILSGEQKPPDGLPLAQAYAGHQFGHFTMLGDGRALLIGEQITPSKDRYDIQLKGSGPTPYSRSGDGKATIGPMLREYIISEAMYALEIPTTRALAVVTTGDTVHRETALPGAVLTRVAASHLRVGTFQFASAWGTKNELQTLVDFAIGRHYPHLNQEDARYRLFLGEVIDAQASLIAQWMLVGFIHGVMNTDNMTISGETIDYGPCAFMDTFDPATVFSSIDHHGRYAYANQPKVAAWNLTRFAETLLPLIHDDQEKAQEIATEQLNVFSALYDKYFMAGMRAKLGLTSAEADDKTLVKDLFQLMYEHEADFTNTFVHLTFEQFDQNALHQSEDFAKWKTRWRKRLGENKNEAREMMKRNNPAVIPRNHRVEEALRPAVQNGDYSAVKKLLTVLEKPYAHSPEQAEFAKPPSPSAIPYRTFCGT